MYKIVLTIFSFIAKCFAPEQKGPTILIDLRERGGFLLRGYHYVTVLIEADWSRLIPGISPGTF